MRSSADPAADPLVPDRGGPRFLKGVFAAVGGLLIVFVTVIAKRVSHSVLSLGSMFSILIAIGATMQVVIAPDFRTPTRFAVALIGFGIGITCGIVQYRLYQRWKHDLN